MREHGVLAHQAFVALVQCMLAALAPYHVHGQHEGKAEAADQDADELAVGLEVAFQAEWARDQHPVPARKVMVRFPGTGPGAIGSRSGVAYQCRGSLLAIDMMVQQTPVHPNW